MNAKQKAAMRKIGCLACGKMPSDLAHIKSKKASGINADWNLIPLCREDHRLQHAMGWCWFLLRFPHIRKHLERIGWEFQELKGRFLMFHKEDE